MTSRGISTQALDRFMIGFTGPPADPNSPADCARAYRISIPYLTPAGPLLIKYRCPHAHDCKENGHGKYVNDTGAELHLFNAQTLRDATRVVVTEGELDAVAVEMAGMPAVAYPGVEAWGKNKHWRWCFDSVDDIVVVADGDQAKDPAHDPRGVGELAALRVLDSLRSAVRADVRVVVMPVGHDSCSFIKSEGQEAFAEYVGWI